MNRPRIVIVGAGFAGLRATQALRNAPVDITLIDRQNHHLFQPLLYQVATAGLSPADIAAPIRSIVGRQKNVTVLMQEVTGVDKTARQVQTVSGAIPYDYLILATGACHSYFGHNEWEKFAPGLKTLNDATTIRRDILLAFEAAEREPDAEARKALLTFVLVGAGPTGVEMAGAIAELAHRALAQDFRNIDPTSARIVLLDASEYILSSYPPTLSEKARQALEKMGVEVQSKVRVTGIDSDGVDTDRGRIECATVIWAAGVAASKAGAWLGVETDRSGRVKVGPDTSVPGHPEIFVLGDTAHFEENGAPLPGVAPVAMQQGPYAARVILSRISGGPAPEPFKYWDKGSMATIGRASAILKAGSVELSGFLAWMAWLFVHILYLVGFRNRLLVLFQWAWAYFTYQRGARLITQPVELPD